MAERNIVGVLPKKNKVVLNTKAAVVVRHNNLEGAVLLKAGHKRMIVAATNNGGAVLINPDYITRITPVEGTEKIVYEVSKNYTCADGPQGECKHLRMCIARGLVLKTGRTQACEDYKSKL